MFSQLTKWALATSDFHFQRPWYITHEKEVGFSYLFCVLGWVFGKYVRAKLEEPPCSLFVITNLWAFTEFGCTETLLWLPHLPKIQQQQVGAVQLIDCSRKTSTSGKEGTRGGDILTLTAIHCGGTLCSLPKTSAGAPNIVLRRRITYELASNQEHK